jgi:V/A-type H+-transporting ATPase subunit E
MRLIEKMQADVDAQVEAILSKAKSEASEIEAQAAGEIEQQEKAARLASLKRLDLERARGAAKIMQAIKKQESELKRDIMEQVFDAARKQLDELGKSEYDKLFTALASETFRDLPEGKFIVAVQEGDKSRATKAVKASKIDATVEETLDGVGGGLVLRSEDGRIFVDNTLQSRLERIRIDGVTLAGKILFPAPKLDEASSEEASKK